MPREIRSAGLLSLPTWYQCLEERTDCISAILFDINFLARRVASYACQYIELLHAYIPSTSIFKASWTYFSNRTNSTAPHSSSLGKISVSFFIGATLDLEQINADLLLFSLSTVCKYTHAPYAFDASQNACK